MSKCHTVNEFAKAANFIINRKLSFWQWSEVDWRQYGFRSLLNIVVLKCLYPGVIAEPISQSKGQKAVATTSSRHCTHPYKFLCSWVTLVWLPIDVPLWAESWTHTHTLVLRQWKHARGELPTVKTSRCPCFFGWPELGRLFYSFL